MTKKKKPLKRHVPFSAKETRSPDTVIEALLECIRSGDLDAFRDVLASHLETANKSHIAERAGIGRRTLYDMIDPNETFNPGLATILAVLDAMRKHEAL